MYEWLEKELAQIKTPEFHVVDRPDSRSPLRRPSGPGADLPPSYQEFVARFGNARLYRQGSAYLVGVRAVPEEGKSASGEGLLCVGHFDDARAYFKSDLVVAGPESPIFEWSGAGLRTIAESFEEWLERRCKDARRRYGKKRWSEIIQGPAPFSDEERAIVDARRQFVWRVLGVTPTGALRFEIENRSARVLPYLSIGVRSRDGRIAGGVWLPVSHLTPGTKTVIERECYANLALATELEAFALPDPEPQDRDRYWEFRTS